MKTAKLEDLLKRLAGGRLFQKQDKKIAFLMPIFPPHYKYAKNFLESFEYYKLNKQADFYFVFSNEEDKSTCKIKYEYKSIILPEYLKDFGREQGIINVKKLYGVYQLKDNYEYIIVCDSESLINKNINLLDICETFFNNKVLWGAIKYPCKEVESFTNACSSLFAEKDKIDDKGLCFWFNQLCIYKANTIDEFFEKANLKENITKLNFWHFDYYIYMYYLMLYHEFKPHNIINIYSDCSDKTCTLNVNYITKYMNIATIEKYKEVKKLVGNKNKIFMLIQLDRIILNSNKLLENKFKVVLRHILSCFIFKKCIRRKIRNGY